MSFLVGDEMVLLEHQSTHNPNMPLRGLLYFAKLYNALVERRGLDLYGKSRLKLPAPRYIVLYFGEDKRPEREVMRLSDSLISASSEGVRPADLEVTATVLNCNEGRNDAIMQASEALRGYAHLLALARENKRAGMLLSEAVGKAVDRCIDEGVLAGYLSERRAEAKEMLFTIEDEERAMRVHWQAVEKEAREHGLSEGLKEGREKGLAEGREEGREEGRAEILAELEARGMTDLAAELRHQ